MTPEQYKALTTEIAYLTIEIKRLQEQVDLQKPVEMHYHYTIDYSEFIKLLREKGHI